VRNFGSAPSSLPAGYLLPLASALPHSDWLAIRFEHPSEERPTRSTSTTAPTRAPRMHAQGPNGHPGCQFVTHMAVQPVARRVSARSRVASALVLSARESPVGDGRADSSAVGWSTSAATSQPRSPTPRAATGPGRRAAAPPSRGSEVPGARRARSRLVASARPDVGEGAIPSLMDVTFDELERIALHPRIVANNCSAVDMSIQRPSASS
jgi:hypothetical protein